LHIFEFVESMDHGSLSTRLERRGSERANIPLSAFGRLENGVQPWDNGTAVAEHLFPLFVYAATVVPPHYHATTRVLLQATAGMRLLPEADQDAIYNALYLGLVTWPDFVFDLARADIATLPGDQEGYFGAVAANYLQGTMDADLHLISSSSQQERPIGALDMGGSSTQLVFLPVRTAAAADWEATSCHATPTTSHEIPLRLQGEDFFATSYLSYGVDQFRERLWNHWVQQHENEQRRSPKSCDAKMIENPCSFRGYRLEWRGYTLVGTGDADQCVAEVQRLIPHHEQVDSADHTLGRHVGGVEHPPVQGKFFAMSLYFFTLDSLRHLSSAAPAAHEALNRSWPTPSIAELHNALDGLCSRAWAGDLQEIQHEAHSFTRAEVLPHRCLESVYMVTLLKDGFGFHPDSRDITFTFLVDGSEVEWTLGMALVVRANESAERLEATA
jgi:Golgi nucleoside diphosphatase